jgi:hypothetical protein
MVNNVVEGSEPRARVSGHPEQSACDLVWIKMAVPSQVELA